MSGFVLDVASSRAIAVVHALMAAVDVELGEAIEAAEGVLTQHSIAAIAKHRLRLSAAAQALETAFLGLEPSAPWPDRSEPRAWLDWLREVKT